MQSKQLRRKVQTQKLTKGQEKFIQALLKGKSQRQAYFEGYPKSKSWTENAVDCAASKLVHNTKVMQRYNQLNEKVAAKQEDAVIFDAKRLRQFWTDVLQDSNSGMKDRLKASELLAKSQGMFVELRETTFHSEDCTIEVVRRED